MNLLFNLGFTLLLAYLVVNAAVSSSEGERPIVQLIAGIGILIMLVYCILNALKSGRITKFWSFSKLWIAFVAMIIFYYIIALADLPSDYASKNPRSLFVAIYIIATAFFIYYGVVYRHLTDGKLFIMISFLVTGGLLDLYQAVTNPLERMGMEVINTSSGYVFVMLLPLLMYRYRNQSFWVFVLLLSLTAITGKRGALAIYCLLAGYYALNLRTIEHSVRFNYKTGVAALLTAVALMYFMGSAYESLMFRIETIVHPKTGTIGSGRDMIWLTLISHWLSSDTLQYFFGDGYYSTIAIEGHIAHNDYIQYLIDYGLFGLLIFLALQLQFFRGIRPVRGLDRYVYCMLFMCLIIFVGRGLSAGTLRTDQIYWSISTGYLLGIATLLRVNHAIKS